MVMRGLREGGVPAPQPVSDFPPVLVADDDLDVRTMLRTLLELDGHEVMEARDGHEAWKVCMEFQGAVVGAGMKMPGFDGLQLCRPIRGRKYSPAVKVMVYRAGMAAPEVSRAAGCDGYFVTPDRT